MVSFHTTYYYICMFLAEWWSAVVDLYTIFYVHQLIYMLINAIMRLMTGIQYKSWSWWFSVEWRSEAEDCHCQGSCKESQDLTSG